MEMLHQNSTFESGHLKGFETLRPTRLQFCENTAVNESEIPNF